jgi:lipopolysaccharide heptosyltransferase I
LRILIVKLSALGDVVQSLPLAMAIHRQMPEAKLDWLVEAPSAGILSGHPALDRVLVSPRSDFSRGPAAGLGRSAAFLNELRRDSYSAVLDLQGLIKSAIFVSLSRGVRRIGFAGGKEPTFWALNEKMPPYDPERHALERYLDFLEPLGLMRPALVEYGIAPTAQESRRGRELAGDLAPDRPLVLLHPVAKWDSKLWPTVHWARLAAMLAAEGAMVALTGSRADQGATHEIAAMSGLKDAVADLAGRTDLRTLAALQAQAALVVSTDTGAMHLAAAMGAPVLALFGPTSPRRTGPYGAGHRVLTRGLECQPCFKRNCGEPRCMIEITPQEVARAALAQLGRPETQ